MTHQCDLAFERKFKKARLFYTAVSLILALWIAFWTWKTLFPSKLVFGLALVVPVVVWVTAKPVNYVKIAVEVFIKSVKKICDWRIHNEIDEKSWFDYHHVDALLLTKKRCRANSWIQRNHRTRFKKKTLYSFFGEQFGTSSGQQCQQGHR